MALLYYLIQTLINVLILYYVYYLEQDKCNCNKDWRHNFIKYFTLTLIVVNTLFLVNKIKTGVHTKVLVLLNLINNYCIYTYIGELDRDNCLCAVKDNALLHRLLYYLRYLFILFPIIILLVALMNIESREEPALIPWKN